MVIDLKRKNAVTFSSAYIAPDFNFNPCQLRSCQVLHTHRSYLWDPVKDANIPKTVCSTMS